jgi:hypothetical protein
MIRMVFDADSHIDEADYTIRRRPEIVPAARLSSGLEVMVASGTPFSSAHRIWLSSPNVVVIASRAAAVQPHAGRHRGCFWAGSAR